MPDPLRRDNSRPSPHTRLAGALTLPAFNSQNSVHMASHLRELIALSCSQALVLALHYLLFVAVFGGTIAMTSNAIRRLW